MRTESSPERCRLLPRRPSAAPLVLAVACLLAACTDLQRGLTGQEPPLPVQAPDSLAAECPSEMRYELPASAGQSLKELRAHAEQRLQALGLQTRWEGAIPQSSFKAFGPAEPDLQRLRRLLAVVLPALERYQPAFLQRVKLREVVLVKDLVVDTTQMRLAMPVPEQDALVYADNANALCPAGMELRVHHELYHVIEHRLFGDFYYRDPAWLALNPEGLDYGQGGASAYGGEKGRPFQNLGHPMPGLVSRYAAYGPEEDKAEVFGWIMTPGYAGRVRAWAEQDPSLAAKRRFMMALVHRLSAGRMSENFFDQLAAQGHQAPVSPAMD